MDYWFVYDDEALCVGLIEGSHSMLRVPKLKHIKYVVLRFQFGSKQSFPTMADEYPFAGNEEVASDLHGNDFRIGLYLQSLGLLCGIRGNPRNQAHM